MHNDFDRVSVQKGIQTQSCAHLVSGELRPDIPIGEKFVYSQVFDVRGKPFV